MVTCYFPETLGARKVRRNLATTVTFNYTKNYLPSPPPHELMRLELSALVSGRPIPQQRASGLGPSLLMHLKVPDRVLKFRSNAPLVSEVQIPVTLNGPLSHRRLDRWLKRRVNVRLFEWSEPNGAIIQSLIYENPVDFPYNHQKSVVEGRNDGGILAKVTNPGVRITSWRSDLEVDRVEHRNFALVYSRISDLKRFPNGPQVVLSYEFVSGLRPGDTFGNPLEPDAPLALSYDRELERLGFAKNTDGHNAVTDFSRYSFPLVRPADRLWDRAAEHPVLAAIQAIRDTPEHSYGDLVHSFVGHRLGVLEAMLRSEHAESNGGKKRCKTVALNHDRPQPCYNGERTRIDRIGRYLIFWITRRGRTFYLVDSNWRDKEVALHLFAELEDARAYCRGCRSATKIGWMIHDEGWETRVEPWVTTSTDRWFAQNQPAEIGAVAVVNA